MIDKRVVAEQLSVTRSRNAHAEVIVLEIARRKARVQQFLSHTYGQVRALFDPHREAGEARAFLIRMRARYAEGSSERHTVFKRFGRVRQCLHGSVVGHRAHRADIHVFIESHAQPEQRALRGNRVVVDQKHVVFLIARAVADVHRDRKTDVFTVFDQADVRLVPEPFRDAVV